MFKPLYVLWEYVCVYDLWTNSKSIFFFSLNLNVLSCKTRKRFKLILSFLLFHSRYKEISHKTSSVIHKDKLKHTDLLSRCTYFSLWNFASRFYFVLGLSFRAREQNPLLSRSRLSHSRQQDVTPWRHRLQRMKERLKQREDSTRNEKRDCLLIFMALLQLSRKCFGWVFNYFVGVLISQQIKIKSNSLVRTWFKNYWNLFRICSFSSILLQFSFFCFNLND